jgi:hypothetical protein
LKERERESERRKGKKRLVGKKIRQRGVGGGGGLFWHANDLVSFLNSFKTAIPPFQPRQGTYLFVSDWHDDDDDDNDEHCYYLIQKTTTLATTKTTQCDLPFFFLLFLLHQFPADTIETTNFRTKKQT